MVLDARPIYPAVRRATEIVALSRPSVWITSLLPFYLGYVLATHRFAPAGCIPPTDACIGAIRPLATGIIVMGPLAWLAILSINDAIDLPGDLHNPRKAGNPLTSGRLSARSATTLAYATAGVTVAAALTIGPAMAALTFGLLVLSWMYSMPPLRLKTRAGWDVAANAVAFGALAQLAGWTAAQPLDEFPWIMAIEGMLVGAAIYMPTTLADFDSDVESNYTTVGVRLGRSRTLIVGLCALALSCLIAIVLAALDYVFPHRMLVVQVVAAPVLLGAYYVILSRALTPTAVVRGCVAFMLMFSALNAVFALMYVGWL